MIRSSGTAGLLTQYSNAPVYRCIVGSELETIGLGHVIVGRLLNTGEVLGVVFLVDIHCLGVKDCFCRRWTRIEFDKIVDNLEERSGQSPVSVDLSTARRLVEDSIAFAAQADLLPHSDYRQCRAIFGNADPSLATRLWEMGYKGSIPTSVAR